MQNKTSRRNRLAALAVALAASKASAALSIDANGSFFHLDGTTNTVANITMALTPSSGTAYGNFIGGTLTVTDTTIVGQVGTALFDHKGGTFNTNRLIISNSATANGTYKMNGGTVNAGQLEIGNGAAASLTVAGGTFTATNITNSALGNVLVRGGTLRVPKNVVVNSGRITGSNNGGIFFNGFNGGLTAPGTGMQAATAGELIIHTDCTVGVSFIRQRSVRMPDASPDATRVPKLSLNARAFGGKTSIVKELIVHKDNAGVPRGRIDIADSALIVDYDAGQTSPLGDIRNMLVHGRNNGAWNGLGITGNVFLDPSRFAVGYAEASRVLGAGGGVFTNIEVDSTAVLVRFTTLGDANLDGEVGFSDLLTVARNFGANNAHWSDGDFDYNKAVNLNDLLVVAAKFGGALPSFIPGASVEFNQALAQVPEPGALGLIGALAATRFRRRRR